MSALPAEYLTVFEERIMKYLLFLVHVQQSITMPAKNKIKIFTAAKDLAKSIYSNAQSYLSNINEYNSFDKNRILTKAFDGIIKEIDKDFDNYKRDITINNLYFSYYNMIETLTNSKFDIFLNHNEIKQMLSYKELFTGRMKEKIENKQLDDLKAKESDEYLKLRRKTFQDMLHGKNNSNPMRYFQVSEYIGNNLERNSIKYCHDQSAALNEGIYFIETKGEYIIKLIREDRYIEYSFRLIDLDDSFIIYIQGSIKINGQEETFYINEKYINSQFISVFNVYNLKKIINIFNELSMDEIKNSAKDDNSSNLSDIDNFLSGKIK